MDEALLEEIRVLDVKCRRVAEDMIDLKQEVIGSLEMQKDIVKKMEEEMVNMLTEKIDKELVIAKKNMEDLGDVMAKSALKTIGVVIVVGYSLVWLWGRQ